MDSRGEAAHITAIIILYRLLLRLCINLKTRLNPDLGTPPLAHFYYGKLEKEKWP